MNFVFKLNLFHSQFAVELIKNSDDREAHFRRGVRGNSPPGKFEKELDNH